MKHKIYILDDHPIVIEGLRKIIDAQDDMSVVGSSEDATIALTDIAKLKPHVVVLDITLRDRSGVDLIKRVKASVPATHVLVYSMHDENVYAERCLRAGAMGYLMKGEGGLRVVQGLRQILGGSFCFSANLIGSIVSGALESSNVDIAEELTTMIEAQRGYTANSKVFQAGSELLDVLMSLKA